MNTGPMLIVLSSPKPKLFTAFAEGAAGAGAKLTMARTGAAALALARTRSPQMVVVDEGLPDYTALELVGELLRTDARINTAVVSSLPEDVFHEQSEGLGILARIPACPDERDGRELIAKLKSLSSPGAAG